MQKVLILGFILLVCEKGFSQQKVDWTKDIEITRSSFQKEHPNMQEDNVQDYFLNTIFDFSFLMPNVQFALTKNFNQYVNAYYVPSLSWIEDGEMTDILLLMANLDFDMTELYARKFRKRMFEEKNSTSSINFHNEFLSEINGEYAERKAVFHSKLRSEENMEELLKQEIETVNQEIEELFEFCKTCKPKKKK